MADPRIDEGREARVDLIRRLQSGEKVIELPLGVRLVLVGESQGQPDAKVEFDGDHALARKLTGCWPDDPVGGHEAARRAVDLVEALSEVRS